MIVLLSLFACTYYPLPLEVSLSDDTPQDFSLPVGESGEFHLLSLDFRAIPVANVENVFVTSFSLEAHFVDVAESGWRPDLYVVTSDGELLGSDYMKPIAIGEDDVDLDSDGYQDGALEGFYHSAFIVPENGTVTINIGVMLSGTINVPSPGDQLQYWFDGIVWMGTADVDYLYSGYYGEMDGAVITFE